MKALTEDQIFETFEPIFADAGIEILTKEIITEEPPFDELPTANFYVSLKGTSGKEVMKQMLDIAAAYNKAHGCEIRSGFYYDEVPHDQAMLSFDVLPFALERTAAPKF